MFLQDSEKRESEVTDVMAPSLPQEREGRPILAFATQGSGGQDEERLLTLLQQFPVRVFPFSRARKWDSFRRLERELSSGKYALAVMEGSGVAGGAALLWGRLRYGLPFVVSSGDAIAPFLSSRLRAGSPLFQLYERYLYRLSAGYIGWSPYLVGRALTLGAPRGVTAEGWSPYVPPGEESRSIARRRIREQLGIPQEAIVVGIAGSLAWNSRVGYCYGLELAKAMRDVTRPDLHVLIVGEGSGRAAIEAICRDMPRPKRIHLAGHVKRDELPSYFAAMDIASLPQSMDGVGSFRYTTKLSEYLAMRLPVMISRIPAAYDLNQGAFWVIEGRCPWEAQYIASVAGLLNTVTPGDLARKNQCAAAASPFFNRTEQIKRVSQFLLDLLAETAGKSVQARNCKG